MLKKLFLSFLIVLFLSVGVTLASQITITGVDSGTGPAGYVGLISFSTNPQDYFATGYCIEEHANSYIGVPYTYTLTELSSDGDFGAAYVWYTNFTNPNFYQVQNAIWDQYDMAFYATAGRNFDLENMFDIVHVANVNGWGQDFMVRSISPTAPVPEPASMLLFGTGLLVFAARLRKFKK